MKICVVSPDFPTTKTIDFVFVEQLCRAFCSRGENVTVIAPQSLTKCLVRGVPFSPYKYRVNLSSNMFFNVIRPKFVTVGNARGLLSNINKKYFDKAVDRVLRSLETKPDVIYCHFWQSGRAAMQYAHSNNIPLFVASGEEHITKERIEFTTEEIRQISEYLSGVINVSTNNQKECIAIKLHTQDNSKVIPNGIDDTLFKQMSKDNCRKGKGINSKEFVVAFVGQMKERKGPLRLDAALKKLNDDKIKVFYIGSGDQEPEYQGVLFRGTIPHSELPVYLSASDVFVLPTRQEGCCNAIIEALACGLPVVSSDLPFNYDVLNKKNSILINPENVDEIAEAIQYLKNNPHIRKEMSLNAIETAKELTLNERANKIISFIKNSL